MTQHEIDEVKWYAGDDSRDWDVSEVRSLLAHIDALEAQLREARNAALEEAAQRAKAFAILSEQATVGLPSCHHSSMLAGASESMRVLCGELLSMKKVTP